MRALVLEAPKTPLALVDRPVPQPLPGQVLLRVRASAVCRTDLHVVDGELPDTKLPIVPGHEIVGEVVKEVPAPGAEPRFSVGARVGVPWLGFSCGQCQTPTGLIEREQATSPPVAHAAPGDGRLSPDLVDTSTCATRRQQAIAMINNAVGRIWAMTQTHIDGTFVRIISFAGAVIASACGPVTPPQATPAGPTQSAAPKPSAAATGVVADAGIEPVVPSPPPDAGADAVNTGPPPCAYELRQTTPTVLVAMAAGRDRGPDARAPGATKIAEEFKLRGVEVLGARDCITCGPICAAIGCNNRMIVMRLPREEARAQICAGMVQEAPPRDIRLGGPMACGAPGPHLVCPSLP